MTVRKFTGALGRRFMKYVYYPIVSVYQDSAWRLPQIHIEWFGSTYGGGWIAIDFLDEQSIVYSFGVGCDITIDELLIRRSGCKVYGFDPTPKSAEWIRNNADVPENFAFVPLGLADVSGKRKLFLPSNPEFVSGSITKNLDGGFIECDFLSLEDIMAHQGHTLIDLMKVDIEGAEYALFERWLVEEYNPPVRQIWVEFHPPMANYTTSRTAKFVRDMKKIRLLPAKRAYVQNPDHYLLLNSKYVAGV